MVEFSNSAIATLILVTLVVAAAGTYVAFVNSPRDALSLTGFATQDSGNVTLTVNRTLAIEVDAAANSISFGTCSPRAGDTYWCASNDSAICDGVDNDQGNCTGDDGSEQYLQVDNIGNVDANVTLDSTCDASTLIGGTGSALQYITTHCNGTAVSTWTNIASSTPGQSGCSNVSFLGGSMRFYVNVTIPQDAIGYNGACAVNQTVVTFTAAAS